MAGVLQQVVQSFGSISGRSALRYKNTLLVRPWNARGLRTKACRYSHIHILLPGTTLRVERRLTSAHTKIQPHSKHLPMHIYNMACPGNKMRWDLKLEDIDKQVDILIAISKDAHDKVGKLNKEDVTYENTIQVLATDHTESSNGSSQLDFYQHVSPDKEMREGSVAADKKLSDFNVEMSMRQDVFDNLEAANEKFGDSLKPEASRYLERLIKLGKRNGLHLSARIQEQIKEILKRMSELSIDFSNNLNEEDTILMFKEEDLVGLPEDLLKSLDRTDDGKVKLTLKYPHYIPCMKFCRNPTTRQTMEIAFNSRCIKENTPILEELVKLRKKKSALLGYPDHASYVLDMRMAKDPASVKKFLAELSVKLQPLKIQEMEIFLSYKKEECEKYGYENNGKINMWDMRYYMTRVEERMYTVDQNKLKEYFPMSVVTKGLLEIYQELLGLKFEQIADAQVWHEDVKLYSVKDETSGNLIGYFYLDLHPRAGKYGHAACFGLQGGCLLKDGTRQVAVAACVANFTKPTADAPSLLTHDEVETYFHEFGHVMHQICALAEFTLFSGTSVERDFVEAPSQMLENWCWEVESVSRMSAHYQDSSPIPGDMLNKLIKSRNANAGIFNLRQILLGSFDQTIHMQDEADTAAEFARLSEEILGIQCTPGTNMPASFGHLAGGYDAQYYGYLWSEVFSADMFQSRFKKEGILNKNVGRSYRENILQPGGSLDAADMLKNFLKREPIQEPFLISKGLSTS